MTPEDEKINKQTDSKVVKVDAKPIVENKEIDKTRIGNITIDKIGSLTLNIAAEPLKKRYEKYYKKNKLHLLVDLVLAAIVIMLLGSLVNLWLFSRAKLFNLMEFRVTSSPEALINGQTTEFVIAYSNTTNDQLTNVALVLKLPDSLRNPQFNIDGYDTKTHTLRIGDMPAKAHGELIVKGLLLDNFDAKQEFLAVINYKNKYGQDRQEFFNQDFILSNSVIETKINLPERLIATSPFDGKFSIKNNSDLTFKNLKVKFGDSNTFRLIKSELGKIDAQPWPIDSLPRDLEKNYNFSGKVYIDKPQNTPIMIETYATYEDKEYLISKSTAVAWTEFARFIIDFINTEKNQIASPGDSTTYTIHYKNTENVSLQNVELGVVVRGEYAEQEKYSALKINLIEPGQEGTAEVNVPIKQNINFDTYNENGYNLEARVFANYSGNSIESLPLMTKLNSRLIVSTAAVFFTSEGDQIGVGSVPPRVGEYTSYWAVIKVMNTNNKVRDTKLIAQLPDGVEFTNIYNVTAGNQIIHHENSNQIEWQIEDIPVLAGYYNPAPEARIQLAITPTESQMGQTPALLSSISVSATDDATGALISAAGKNITTAISSDNSLNKVIE
ncbi:hypothetical protein JW977_03380 [Candidatus Falkowbacteria bacterium]|nr:hypothetical protein [Candidatus Falkowbacteria bacterium]